MFLLYISANFLNFWQLPSCCNILIKVRAFMPGREADSPWARMAKIKKKKGKNPLSKPQISET